MKAWQALLVAVTLVHLIVALPGADRRGVIAEEVQPYLRRHPRLLDDAPGGIVLLPPNDDPDRARWVGTPGWPEVAYVGAQRTWPLFVRAHQSAIGTYVGLLVGPLLGGGIAGVRRTSVLLGLLLVLLSFWIARRWELDERWSGVAALGVALSPGLWFFCRTGYAFELASRVLMLATLLLAAPRAPLTWRRAVAVGATFALAVLSRATIAVTLAPLLLLLLLHPRRFAGMRRIGFVFVLAAAAPILLVGGAILALPFTALPAGQLPWAALASRTLVAPSVLAAQLGWVVDPRTVLLPLLRGGARADLAGVPSLVGGVVLACALVRWWRGQAREGERLFACGVLANALAGAWLYGDPLQFQLGMSIEPLFAIAVAHQLADLPWPRAAGVVAAALLAIRLTMIGTIAVAEHHTDNPMLSSAAQRALVDLLGARQIAGDDLITTTYDHVGVVESWTDEALRPLHAYRPLRRGPDGQLERQWTRLLAARPACHVLLTRAHHLFEGSFTDLDGIAAGLDRAVTARGGRITGRTVIAGDGGGPVFELVDVTPCGVRP